MLAKDIGRVLAAQSMRQITGKERPDGPEFIFREVFTPSTAGWQFLFTNNTQQNIEIIDLFAQPSAATTVQFRANGTIVTPNISLVANQIVCDPGFVLFKGQSLELNLGGAVSTPILMRWRLVSDGRNYHPPRPFAITDGAQATTIATDSKINVDQWGSVGTTLGQKLSASSVPVVLPSDIANLPISIAAIAAALADANPVPVKLEPATKATYHIVIAQAVISVAGICFVIKAGAKKVNILEIVLQGTQTTAAQSGFDCTKYSTFPTLGTPAAVTPVKVDQSDAAASCTASAYTGATAPTAGTLIGTVDTQNCFLGASATVIGDRLALRFGDGGGLKPLVLAAGSTECVAIVIRVAIAGNFINIRAKITEE